MKYREILAYTILTGRRFGLLTCMHEVALKLLNTGIFEITNTIAFEKEAQNVGATCFKRYGSEHCAKVFDEVVEDVISNTYEEKERKSLTERMNEYAG